MRSIQLTFLLMPGGIGVRWRQLLGRYSSPYLLALWYDRT